MPSSSFFTGMGIGMQALSTQYSAPSTQQAIVFKLYGTRDRGVVRSGHCRSLYKCFDPGTLFRAFGRIHYVFPERV